MAKPCFYYPELLSQGDAGAVIQLSSSESAHALQSRRLRVGSKVCLINAQGGSAEAEITEVGKRSVSVTIESLRVLDTPCLKLHLAVAMPKGDKQKQMVDMLTQLGVSTLIPMLTGRCVSIPKARQLEKLARVSLEACKQSHNPWVLKIAEPQTFDRLIQSNALMIYADQSGASWDSVKDLVEESGDVIVFIGPEGGFSVAEMDSLEQSGAVSITLGSHILRTETAAIAAATLFKC